MEGLAQLQTHAAVQTDGVGITVRQVWVAIQLEVLKNENVLPTFCTMTQILMSVPPATSPANIRVSTLVVRTAATATLATP